MSQLIKILSTRFASISCFLFAVANRVIFTSLYSAIGRDTKLQLSYSENLLAGNGLGVSKYFTTDLQTPVFDTYQSFPPGLSLAIIPYLKIFNGDEYKAILAFDICAAVLFIIAVRMLGKKAGLPVALNNIITIIAGCFQYPFFMSWSSTDAVSVALLFFAISAMINLTNKNNSWSFAQLLGFGVLFFLPSFFRFMYLPVTILLPVIVLIYGIHSKNRTVSSAGLKLVAISVFLSVALFLFKMIYGGSGYYVYTSEQGVYFNQVLQWYPFLPASFINLDFAGQLAARLPGMDYSLAFLVFEIANIILFVMLVFLFARYFNIYRKTKALSAHFIFIITGSVISFLILLTLAWFSLTNKAEDWGKYKWTHVLDVRYYAFIYIFIPLLFFTCLHYYPSVRRKLIPRIFIIAGLFLFTIESLHGIYYNAKIVTRHEDLAAVRNMGKDYKSFPDIIADLKKQYQEHELLVSSRDQYFLLTASQLGCKPVFDYQNLNNTDPKVLVKSLLIVPVHIDDASFFQAYIERKKPKAVSVIAGTSFYIQEIDP